MSKMSNTKIQFNLKNCYGIKKFNKTFDLKKGQVMAIYAPNGVMKTSIAKIFEDIKNDTHTKDMRYEDLKTNSQIKLNDEEISHTRNSKSIVIIKSLLSKYNDYSAHILPLETISKLLLSKNLKKEFIETYQKISFSKNKILESLKDMLKASKIDTIEKRIIETYENENFDDILKNLKLIGFKKNYSDLEYNEKINILFDKKVDVFLFARKNKIEKYIRKFNELTKESVYLQENFEINKLENVSKILKENNFFKSKHKLNLFNKKTEEYKEIKTNQCLTELITTERDKVFDNEEMKKIFKEINPEIKNKSLRDFRKLLENNPSWLLELNNLKIFKKNVFNYFFKKIEKDINKHNEIVKETEIKIKDILEKAKKEKYI